MNSDGRRERGGEEMRSFCGFHGVLGDWLSTCCGTDAVGVEERNSDDADSVLFELAAARFLRTLGVVGVPDPLTPRC